MAPNRHNRIGGTEIGILCGIPSFGNTILDVYNRVVLGVSKFQGNAYSDRGIAYEPIVRAEYVRATGAKLRPHLDKVEFEEFGAASFDDIAERGGWIGPVDYKTASVKGKSKWKKGVPENYEYQLRWYLAAMRIALGIESQRAELYAAFGVDEKDANGNFTGVFDIQEFQGYEVHRDIALENRMLGTAREFWRNHVVPKRPPAGQNKSVLVKVSDMNLSKEEMEFLGLAAPQTQVASQTTSVLPATPVQVVQGHASFTPTRRIQIIDETGGDEVYKPTSNAKEAYPTDGPGWVEIACRVCATPLGKRPPGHKIDPSLCPNAANHATAAILPPDAPASHPELAAACPHCPETEKPQQHLLADCPTLNAPPAVEKPKRTRRTAKQIANDNALAAASAAGAASMPSPVVVVPAAVQAGLAEISAIGQAQITEHSSLCEASVGAPCDLPAVCAPAPSGLHLYVNALPGPGVQATSLAPYVDLITRKLAELTGDQDIRASDAKQYAFAKWKGQLAAAVRECPPQPGAYVAMTSESEFVQIAVEALSGLCAPGFPVRGVR